MTTAPAQPQLQTWRCTSCGRIAAKVALAPGSVVEVRCKCGTFNTITVSAAAASQTRV